ncbi:22279_t:CDS:2 [Cetraspora pellucida]|uniref:22279_t:CDS:1 n=1 Tax=Cetraspora pellucida TaxID=1433469 RepID=A0A9N8ZS39_9GLOM|nr:22279_t:CDS:2 [Cetraspora pellucida]
MRPELLWEKHILALSDDILEAHNNTDQHNRALKHLESILLKHRMRLENFPNMPIPILLLEELFQQNYLIIEELQYDIELFQHRVSELHPHLNSEQLTIYNAVILAVENLNPKIFFIDGPDDTATFGIVVLLLEEGCTAHSLFKILIVLNEDSTSEDASNPQNFTDWLLKLGKNHITQIAEGSCIILPEDIVLSSNNIEGLISFVYSDLPIYAGACIFLPYITLTPSNSDLPFMLMCWQFPIQPAFAMIINKAQGQTLNRVGIYLQTLVFSHGQLYVAYSRITFKQNLKILTLDRHEGAGCTKNIVYSEVLQ